MQRTIKELLARRADLSSFLVHLTREDQQQTGYAKLISILDSGMIEARSPLGHAIVALRKSGIPTDSQKVVCFTETPLEYVNLLLGEVEGRSFNFAPYGIAVSKRMARKHGVNPVWYVDITPGHEWLSNSINKLINEAIEAGDFSDSPISALAPFIEQMGSGQSASGQGGYKKEFWWEREWRRVGDFLLPFRFIVLCPEAKFNEIRHVRALGPQYAINFVDSTWSREQIIERLEGFDKE